MTEKVMIVTDRNMTCLTCDRWTRRHSWGRRFSMIPNLITDMESRSQFTWTFHSHFIPLYTFINRMYYICLHSWHHDVQFYGSNDKRWRMSRSDIHVDERENFAYVFPSCIRPARSSLSHFIVTRMSSLGDKFMTLEYKRQVCTVTGPASQTMRHIA